MNIKSQRQTKLLKYNIFLMYYIHSDKKLKFKKWDMI